MCLILFQHKQRRLRIRRTAFYNSPELFQKKYTSKTDVFSAGVALYVLVAGYPADQLQKAFNLLQKANRDLKTLPGMPEGMPGSYFDMLNKMLTYQQKKRKSAAEILDDDDLVLFHAQTAGKAKQRPSISKTQSLLLVGTGERAAAGVGYTKFQRLCKSSLILLLLVCMFGLTLPPSLRLLNQ